MGRILSSLLCDISGDRNVFSEKESSILYANSPDLDASGPFFCFFLPFFRPLQRILISRTSSQSPLLLAVDLSLPCLPIFPFAR